MKLPEPFNGRPVGRLKSDGRLVVLRRAPGTKVIATVLDETLEPIEGETETVERTSVEPLTTTARDVLNAEIADVEGKVSETMRVWGEKGELKRHRKDGKE